MMDSFSVSAWAMTASRLAAAIWGLDRASMYPWVSLMSLRAKERMTRPMEARSLLTAWTTRFENSWRPR